MSGLQRPRVLGAAYDPAGFDCGQAELDDWLVRHARIAQAAGSAQTFVACSGERIAGYYALAAGAVERRSAHGRLGKGMPRHPVPVVILARLAVDRRDQGQGLGRALVRDAMLRTLAVSETLGVRALLAHAVDARAAGFYARLGFEPSPSDPLHLALLIKDVRASLGSR